MSNSVFENRTATSATPTSAFDPFAGPVIVATAPSTEPQREIWSAALVGDDASLAYNESVTLSMRGMRGRLDVAALRRSLAELVARHEALRSTFSGDGLTLMVNEGADVPLEELDWSGRGEDARGPAWRDLLRREVSTPFDLRTGPLARAVVVHLGPEEHRVVFTAHHIVCDGASTGTLIRDWAALYSAATRGERAELPAAPSFATFARELAARRASAKGLDDEAYWVKRFSDEVPVLDLPTDRPRPPLKTYASAREDYVLAEDLVRDVKRVGAKERASLFVTLLAGFEVLLFRLSGQADLVVGVPAAGQQAEGWDQLVGHCVNMLPLRGRVDASAPFRSFLEEARGAVLDGFEHQELTFGALLTKLSVARDPSRLPLVSVVFNLDRGISPEQASFAGLHTEVAGNPRTFENFELFINSVELGGRVTLECQYNADLFDGATIRRWLAVYERLLRAIADGPETPIGKLPVLSPEERAQLAAWNDESKRAVEAGTCVHHLVERQAARTPDAVAVSFEDSQIRYAELDRRANALAHRLRGLGVRRGVLVGLCIERSIDMIVGLLGISKAGGAYVPLDPGYPADRLAFMMSDSGMTVVVTQQKLRADLPGAVANVVEIEGVERSAEPLAGDADASQAEDTAYVIYTSGSTGKPKGVLVPHRAVVNLLASVREKPGMTERDVVLAVTTLSFDIAVSELLLPLTVGAKIVIASREVAADGAQLLALLRRSKATFVDATPATWRLLLAAGWSAADRVKAICTGEAMPRDVAGAIVERCGSVWNGYGPTETTVWSTFYEVKPPVGRVLIGRPVGNTQLHVVDARLEQVPIGVVGELLIGGAGVTKGYLNRPELTQERFVHLPHLDPRAPVYRTGDLVRVLPDGNLECLGRNDNQVKVRGFRIELGEIENALGQHPAVRSAAVIVREDRPGDVRIVAYVVLNSGAAATDAELRAQLKTTLPDYMLPQTTVRLDSMPLTPSGKIDRKRLPAPTAEATSDEAFVAPRTDVERMLAALWQEILGIGRAGVHDDFFALGGHSLLASQLLARLRRDHGINLSFRKIFEAPTVEKLAQVIAGDAALTQPQAQSQAEPARTIEPRPTSGPAPLSTNQRRLWLLEEMDPEQKVVHNLPAAWRLEGRLDLPAFERALNELCVRHETLRTGIRVENGEPVQVIAPSGRIPLEVVDLSHLSEPEREKTMLERCDALTATPFDLANDALVRAVLFRVAEDEHVFFTLRHNIIWDGWSFDVFLKDLGAIYGAFARGELSPLAPLPVSYADFAVWQREWLAGEAAETQAGFWRKQLEDEPAPLEVPSDRPRRGTRSHAGANEAIHFTRETADALTALAREHGATLFMTMYAAFVVLLHRHSGQTDMLIGVPVRARTRPELEDLIGPFVNNVTLRTRIEPGMTFLDLLARVRDTTLDAFSHQDLPLEALGGRPPMVRAFFSLQDARGRPEAIGDLAVRQWHVQPPAAASEMMLWTMEGQKDLLAMMNFSTELYDRATIVRFLRQLEVLLTEVLRDPRQPVSEIPILPAAERARIAAAGKAEVGEVSDVLSAIRAVARANPAAIAIDAGDRRITHADLSARAERVARRLREQGIREGARVRVEIPSAVEAAVAVLGVLGAGATLALAGQATTHVLRELDEAAAAAEEPQAPTLECLAFANVRQRELVGSLAGLARAVGIDPRDVVVAAMPLDTVAGLYALLAPLVAGATANLAAGFSPEPRALRDALAHATGSIATPEVWRSLVAAGFSAAERFKAVVLGPAQGALSRELPGRVQAAFTAYAPWSAHRVVAVHRMAANEVARVLGKPVGAVELRVVDRRGQLSPIGVPGELVVIEPSGAEVRTGDRARLLDDGELELVGRDDRRVEVRGAIVDLDTLARELAKHPAVQSAALAVREDRRGEPRLVAYYVARPGESYTETELRDHLRASLPVESVPQALVELEELPRFRTGGLDEERLPSPYTTTSAEEHVAPRAESERYLAKVWSEALGISRVGAHDNFFDLGGHSLLCFQVIARIERETGKRLSPRLMLLNSLEQLAPQLDGAAARTTAQPAPAVPQRAPEAQSTGSTATRVLRRLRDLVKR